MVGFDVGFPRKNFPHNYYYEETGKKMRGPYIPTFVLYAPLGFTVKPFQNNFRIYIEAAPSFAIQSLWNGSFKQNIATKSYYSFVLNLVAGVGWKGINGHAGFLYDSITKFSFSFSLCYRIDITYKKARTK
ncbi:hypothetical protein DWQ65_05600 [Treponema phagedenis]|uniref:hypothetical protein n=1 Tax=Treponema phagedenis TaxID=162 RepID=UPI0001F63EC9|nr:hypothetical protein [Treponema phagedenis]EFW37760.1 hypothetical protein HMPREF9554_01763 [Treponema phagedenis F0421]QKS91899.1 hypothetical protein HPJ96_04530 [Treponema phagedenis]QLC58838.1 hypothetical protein HW453_08485 [Treponema phagedenis]QSH93957.1 hypothetical protein C5O78_02630 [Treponema phagedenis]QSH99543.1 hypothetical protein DWQ65_05600 [Treponema phagedenis]